MKEKDVIIIGGGKSVRDGISLGLWDKIKDMDTWSCNYASMFMDHKPSREIFVDRKFFSYNKEWLFELSKTVQIFCRYHDVIESSGLHCKMYNVNKEKYLGRKLMTSQKSLFVGSMGVSGFFAISLAILEGYDRCWLLGFDYGCKNYKDTDTHWYQKDLLRNKDLKQEWISKDRKLFSTGVGNSNVYVDSDKNSSTFGCLKRDKDNISVFSQDIEIYNVSMDSNIDCFSKINYQQMFEMLGV